MAESRVQRADAHFLRTKGGLPLATRPRWLTDRRLRSAKAWFSPATRRSESTVHPLLCVACREPGGRAIRPVVRRDRPVQPLRRGPRRMDRDGATPTATSSRIWGTTVRTSAIRPKPAPMATAPATPSTIARRGSIGTKTQPPAPPWRLRPRCPLRPRCSWRSAWSRSESPPLGQTSTGARVGTRLRESARILKRPVACRGKCRREGRCNFGRNQPRPAASRAKPTSRRRARSTPGSRRVRPKDTGLGVVEHHEGKQGVPVRVATRSTVHPHIPGSRLGKGHVSDRIRRPSGRRVD